MKGRIKALETAIKLEEEGKEFYTKASEKTSQPYAKNLFKSLAESENRHILRVKEIYEKIKSEDKWPKLVTPEVDISDKKSVFPKDPKITDDEFLEISDAINIGIEMEEKSIKFYDDLTEKATDPFEKRFYIVLSREERGHYLDLWDYLEYLQDPAGWFGMKEGFRLDG